MKKAMLALAASVALAGCVSVESAIVSSADVAGHGEAVQVFQAKCVGFTLFLHYVEVVPCGLDDVINKYLVKEAKAASPSNKVEIKSASTTARHGIFALPALLIGFPTAEAVGVVVK